MDSVKHFRIVCTKCECFCYFLDAECFPPSTLLLFGIFVVDVQLLLHFSGIWNQGHLCESRMEHSQLLRTDICAFLRWENNIYKDRYYSYSNNIYYSFIEMYIDENHYGVSFSLTDKSLLNSKTNATTDPI